MASMLSASPFYQVDGALLSSAGKLVSYKEFGECEGGWGGWGGCPH